MVADLERVSTLSVFQDRSLKEMAARLPQTDAAFLTIYGVDEAKLRRYGKRFMGAIERFCREHGLEP